MIEAFIDQLSSFIDTLGSLLSGVVNAGFVIIDMLYSILRLFSWGSFLPGILFICLSTIICIGIVKLILGR